MKYTPKNIGVNTHHKCDSKLVWISHSIFSSVELSDTSLYSNIPHVSVLMAKSLQCVRCWPKCVD